MIQGMQEKGIINVPSGHPVIASYIPHMRQEPKKMRSLIKLRKEERSYMQQELMRITVDESRDDSDNHQD